MEKISQKNDENRWTSARGEKYWKGKYEGYEIYRNGVKERVRWEHI